MNNTSQILNVPVEDILPNRFQPRLSFDENGLKELAASIKEHGIIQPLVLRRLNDKYEIIAGERRYKAAKMAGLTSVPAIISEMDDRKSAEVAIVENIQRRDLSSIEEAKSYKSLLDKGYLTQEELAKRMGLSQSAISNKLRLLSLSETVQNALMEGKISERHARSLLQLSDENAQNEWLSKIITDRLTVKELDRRLKELNKKEEKSEEIPLIEPTVNIQELKAKATDISSSPIIENMPNQNIVIEEPKIIPNKFFNFLEDEEANMSIVEGSQNPIIDDEIEMLDFDISSQSKEETDLQMIDKALNSFINELEMKNYKINLRKDNLEKEYKITISIEKE